MFCHTDSLYLTISLLPLPSFHSFILLFTFITVLKNQEQSGY